MKELYAVSGVRLSTVAAQLRYHERDDLTLVEIADGGEVACVFTQNLFAAAPVLVAKSHVASGNIKYLLINAGQANAGTGEAGVMQCKESCEALAALVGCEASQILPFSTGVIGDDLPVAKMCDFFQPLVDGLGADHWQEAALAIMTTDTKAKAASVRYRADGGDVTVTGISKGAGMICPNMATMLAFVATDAAIGADDLQQCLDEVMPLTFNAITVDGDTSTNDACVLIATGKGVGVSSAEALDLFKQQLRQVMTELAQMIIRDAEGATKFITIDVVGGRSDEECQEVARTVAHSPLVKTALFASDPNWGRILAAVGRARIEPFDIQAVRIFINDLPIVSDGGRAQDYDEAKVAREMSGVDVCIKIDMCQGTCAQRVWTSDLSHDYVTINAEYRT